eukprot:jgi/Astpho2/7577/Aster-02483
MLHGDAEGGYRGHPYKAIRADKHLMGAKCPGSTMKQGSVSPHDFRARQRTLQQAGVPTYNFGAQTLTEGSYGEGVVELQRFLHSQGYITKLQETPDGYTGFFGALTAEAVKEWQKDVGLPETGAFDGQCRLQYLQQQVVAGIGLLLLSLGALAWQARHWLGVTQEAQALDRQQREEDREHQLGQWRGNVQQDRQGPSWAGRPSSPSGSSGWPWSNAQSAHRQQTPQEAEPEPSGPAVSLDGFPQLRLNRGAPAAPLQPAAAYQTLNRGEQPQRAGLLRPATGSRAQQSEQAARRQSTRTGGSSSHQENGAGVRDDAAAPQASGHRPVVMPAWQVTSRPRSPNPTHMPEDLNKPPALRPGLSEHAKNWVEIAVSQRSSPGGLSGTDRQKRSNGASANGASSPPPSAVTSSGAQVLYVDTERDAALNGSGTGQSGGSGGPFGSFYKPRSNSSVLL